MKLTNEDLDFEVTHRHGGNAFGIVQMLGDNYCRVVSLGNNAIGCQAFLAYGNMLTRSRVLSNPQDKDSPLIDKPLSDDLVPKLSTLRNNISTGKTKIVSTHFVDSK